MRRGQQPCFIAADDGSVIGVSLGSDFCAEHEWGIKSLRAAFGLPDSEEVFGLGRRQITKVPTGLQWFMKDGTSGFGFVSPYCRKPDEYLRDELRSWGGTTLAGAWSDTDFGAASTDAAEIAYLREVFDAFMQKDGAIFMGGTKVPVFDNPGLVLAIASRIPTEYVEGWDKADREALSIKQDMERTGIKELLAKAGRRYYALSPARQKDGSLRYWLNPMEQNANNFGWYSEADLRAWAEGKGPIPKSAVAVRR